MLISLLVSSQLLFAKPDTQAVKTIDVAMLHPRVREWAYPVKDVKVPANSVCLLWPSTPGKNIAYKIMMATDAGFTQNVIAGDEQRWAVYPIHQNVKEGKWYWKYAYKTDNPIDKWQWSETNSFIVERSQNSISSPSPKQVLENLKGQQHPRLWSLNKNAETFYGNNKNNPEAKAFVAAMRKQLGKTLPEEKPTRPRDTTGMNALQKKQMIEFMYHGFGNKVANPIKDLVLAYYLTKERAFMDEAIKQGVHVAKMDPEGYATRDDFNNGNIVEGLATLYDMGFSFLKDSEKQLLKNAIAVRGQMIYKGLPNRFELQMCDNHVWQHILRNFSIAALAVANDVPEANEWLTYVYEVWNARFPVLASTDGGWHEGNGYFRVHYKTLIYLPMLFGDLSGRNYYEEEWMNNLAYYILYSYPIKSTSVSQGDMHENLKDIVRNHGLFADALSTKINNPYLTWYAHEIRKLYPDFFRANDDFLLFRLLNYKGDKVMSVSKVPSDLPKSRDFRDIGLVAMHSDLVNTARNTTVFLTSNPYGVAGHAHAAQNAITINYKGKKVYGGTGFYSNFSDAHNLLDYRSSRGHCTILADSLSQRLGEDGYGWIPRFITGNRIQYALGDASNAYGNLTTDFWLDRFTQIGIKADKESGYGDAGVKKFRRHVLQLDSNYVVVYDELESVKPIKWTSQMHSPFQLTHVSAAGQKSKTFDLQADFVKSNVTVFSSSTASINIHDQYNFPAKNWKGKTDDEGNIIEFSEQWHAGITSQPTIKQRFLTVIQIQEKQLQPIKQAVLKNNMQQVQIGGWTISANLETGKEPFLQVVSSDQKSLFNYGSSEVKSGKNLVPRTISGSSVLVEKGRIQEVVDERPNVTNLDTGR